MSTSRFILSLTASLALATFVWASDKPTLEQRLEKLAESLETARERAHIPGMAIAIVRGDDVVLARRGWLNTGSTLRGNPSSPSFWRCCVRAMRFNGVIKRYDAWGKPELAAQWRKRSPQPAYIGPGAG